MVDKKELEKYYYAARNDNEASFDMIEKNSFSEMLTGIKIKLLSKVIEGVRSKEMEVQIASLDRMDNFLERLTFKNCVFIFQSKTILSQDRRIIILEQEKMDLITRSTSKIKELEKELESVKKRIKNDK